MEDQAAGGQHPRRTQHRLGRGPGRVAADTAATRVAVKVVGTLAIRAVVARAAVVRASVLDPMLEPSLWGLQAR
jgi:hypothetical protein